MYNSKIHDKLEEIKESIELIQEWSKNVVSADDFMLSPDKYMAFNACVMRLQVIGEHVGKLLKIPEKPLSTYSSIPWEAIYGMRNLISHEYANIDEEIVYDTIRNGLPQLLEVVKQLLKQY